MPGVGFQVRVLRATAENLSYQINYLVIYFSLVGLNMYNLLKSDEKGRVIIFECKLAFE